MDPADKAWAIDIIEKFEKRAPRGVWTNMEWDDLALDLRDRLETPDHINQQNSNLCGVAAFARDWLIDDPVDYVWFAICLFELGMGNLSRKGIVGRTIRPSQGLRSSPRGKTPGVNISQADWVVLGSIREDLNVMLEYNADERPPIPFIGGLLDGARGWNTPGEVETLFKRAGYTEVHNFAGGWKRLSADHLRIASDYFVANYKVVLLIDYRVLRANLQDTEALVATSNHFVGLISPVIFDPPKQNLSFTVFSGGNKEHVPENSLWMPVKTLERHYYGFIAARY